MVEAGGVDQTGAHSMMLRVYYEDTDAGGLVYYANYLKFAERARTEWLRALGFESSDLAASAGAGWVVRRCEVDYLRPARLDDEVEVRTRVVALGGASADLEQTVLRGAVELARLLLRLALVTPAGKPRRLPAALRAAMQNAIQPLSGA
jgi:acyl-CoA thioester hydrolase